MGCKRLIINEKVFFSVLFSFGITYCIMIIIISNSIFFVLLQLSLSRYVTCSYSMTQETKDCRQVPRLQMLQETDITDTIW